jgi:SAM-dependent methyltransferase
MTTCPTISPSFSFDVQLEENPCPNGCLPGGKTVAAGGDVIHFVPGDYRAVRCEGCGLVRTTPRPTQETIGAYYPPDYGPYGEGAGAPQAGGSLGRVREYLSARANGTLVPDLAPGTVLEIGCASGWFLDRMRAKGWRTLGVEVSPEMARTASGKGHEVWSGAVERMPAPAARADLIVGWMVLEHLHDPHAALRRLHAVAAPGALCAFSTPDFSAPGRRLLGQFWILLDLPRHLFHYEPETLRDMLRQCGWEPVKIVHSSTSGFALSSVGRFARSRGWNHLFEFLQSIADGRRWNGVRRALGIVLGIARQSGAMTVWARRKEE